MSEAGEDDYPWPDGPWVRALFVMSLEGAYAGPDGRSGSISGPADRRILAAVRRWSDAVVVGATTMRVERYSPMRVNEAATSERLVRGMAPAPRLVVVSASLDLPWSDPVYSESAMAPLIVTTAAAPQSARSQVPDTCELVVAPDERVDPGWLIAELGRRGLVHIVCEGGPGLLRDFLRARAIDEWALTLSGLTSAGAYVPAMARAEDEFVFTRFIRSGGP